MMSDNESVKCKSGMQGSSSGAYWISSISTGGGKRCMKKGAGSFWEGQEPGIVQDDVGSLRFAYPAQKGCLADLAGAGDQQHRDLPGSFLNQLSRVRVRYMEGRLSSILHYNCDMDDRRLLCQWF